MSKFKNKPYIKRVEKPWGYELHFVPEDKSYMGKILHIKRGTRISLQYHDQKMESWFLLFGKVTIVWENEKSEMEEINMDKGFGYTTSVNQKHRLIAVEDSEILEVSPAEIGNTFRIEDDYSRPTETEELRKDPNRGWNPKD